MKNSLYKEEKMKKYLIAALLAATVSDAKVRIDHAPIATPIDVNRTQVPMFNIGNRLYLPL